MGLVVVSLLVAGVSGSVLGGVEGFEAGVKGVEDRLSRVVAIVFGVEGSTEVLIQRTNADTVGDNGPLVGKAFSNGWWVGMGVIIHRVGGGLVVAHGVCCIWDCMSGLESVSSSTLCIVVLDILSRHVTGGSEIDVVRVGWRVRRRV